FASAGDLALAAHEALSDPDQDHADNILRRSQEATLPAGSTITPAPTLADTEMAPAPSPAPAANTPPPAQSSAPPYSGAAGPASGPIPRAPQTGQPWAPASGPVPAAGQAAAYYQGAGPNWGSPPPQQPWNQPPKPKRNPWPIIAAVAVVLVVAVAGVGIWLMIRPKPAPPPPDPIPADRLSALLLGPSDINSIMGSSTMEPGKPIQSMDTSSVTLSSPDCQGALYTSQDPVYAGSGYTGVSGLVSSEPGDNYDHWVNQAVVRFPSADKAKSFMQTAAGKWKGCAGKTVTVTNKGKTYRWTFAQINGSPPKMTVLDTQEGADGWECERAMSQANNVIVDVNACGYHITDQGGQITDKIVGKIETE
ncbi:sensor domain-containing protein, partial [Mycobacterium heidelbergense]|uniref:sensor domain-containing protein n=1 Tax=Mycobacterium heidelbergense TaxID=53376 RepID=UPI003CFA1E5F